MLDVYKIDSALSVSKILIWSMEITGEVGTGKTTICRTFLENLNKNTEVAYIFNPKLNSVQLLKAINEEFGISSDFDNIKDLVNALNLFLIEKKSIGTNVILLIDENSLFLTIGAGNKAVKTISSNDLIKEVAPIINGSGGGKPAFARGSGNDASKINDAIDKFKELLQKTKK